MRSSESAAAVVPDTGRAGKFQAPSDGLRQHPRYCTSRDVSEAVGHGFAAVVFGDAAEQDVARLAQATCNTARVPLDPKQQSTMQTVRHGEEATK